MLAALMLGLVMFGAWSAFADHVEPTFEADNPSCEDFDESWSEKKVEPVADGEYTDGTLTVTIEVDEDAKTIDWSSNIGVDAVFVKGGPNGNLYTYDPPAEATNDSGLHAPLNDSSPEEGDFYGLSHISFCYDVEGSPSPSPSVSPSETPTETPTQTPTETPSDSPTPTPSETTPGVTVSPTATVAPSVLGTKTTLGNTGADVRNLILLGVMLVGLGALAYTVARRTQKAR